MRTDSGGAEHRTDEIRAVPLRRPGRWAATVVVLVLAAMLGHSLATNSGYGWSVVGTYFFSGPVVGGVGITLELTVLAMAIGIGLGIVLAIMRLSANPILSSGSWLFLWFFRGSPVYVQLIFWYNIGALYPRLGIGIPFGSVFVHGSSNSIVTGLVAALLGLGLNEAAYYAEIVRAGILAVDHGQLEAAQSLGMRRLQLMRKIVLPQAMRVILPPTGNETISMLKTSSLVSLLAVGELMYKVQQVYARTYQTIPLLIVAVLWYLAMTTVLTIGQYYVERYYARGSSFELPPTPLQRLRRLGLPRRRSVAPLPPLSSATRFARHEGTR